MSELLKFHIQNGLPEAPKGDLPKKAIVVFLKKKETIDNTCYDYVTHAQLGDNARAEFFTLVIDHSEATHYCYSVFTSKEAEEGFLQEILTLKINGWICAK